MFNIDLHCRKHKKGGGGDRKYSQNSLWTSTAQHLTQIVSRTPNSPSSGGRQRVWKYRWEHWVRVGNVPKDWFKERRADCTTPVLLGTKEALLKQGPAVFL